MDPAGVSAAAAAWRAAAAVWWVAARAALDLVAAAVVGPVDVTCAGWCLGRQLWRQLWRPVWSGCSCWWWSCWCWWWWWWSWLLPDRAKANRQRLQLLEHQKQQRQQELRVLLRRQEEAEKRQQRQQQQQPTGAAASSQSWWLWPGWWWWWGWLLPDRAKAKLLKLQQQLQRLEQQQKQTHQKVLVLQQKQTQQKLKQAEQQQKQTHQTLKQLNQKLLLLEPQQPTGAAASSSWRLWPGWWWWWSWLLPDRAKANRQKLKQAEQQQKQTHQTLKQLKQRKLQLQLQLQQLQRRQGMAEMQQQRQEQPHPTGAPAWSLSWAAGCWWWWPAGRVKPKRQQKQPSPPRTQQHRGVGSQLWRQAGQLINGLCACWTALCWPCRLVRTAVAVCTWPAAVAGPETSGLWVSGAGALSGVAHSVAATVAACSYAVAATLRAAKTSMIAGSATADAARAGAWVESSAVELALVATNCLDGDCNDRSLPKIAHITAWGARAVASCGVWAAAPVTSAFSPLVVGLLQSPEVNQAASIVTTEVWLVVTDSAFIWGTAVAGGWEVVATAWLDGVEAIVAVEEAWCRGPFAGASAALAHIPSLFFVPVLSVRVGWLIVQAIWRSVVRTVMSVAVLAAAARLLVVGRHIGRGAGGGAASGAGSWWSRLLALI
jgi:hypothetical protein